MIPAYDTSTLARLRQTLDDVLADPRFRRSQSMSALDVAQYILSEAAQGERDFDRIKISALNALDISLREAA
ncbi:MAG: hypothetical protein H7312_12390 [Tardiphaga sp.]|jgi:hypothetical protein|nr:hypothetical protein [Tardiphaga sp.]